MVDCWYAIERRQRDKSPHKKQNVPFVHVDANVGFRPNGGKQPIYQPRPSALNRGQVASTDDGADAPLDRSGYADLGLGIVRQASLEALDDNGGVDMRGRGAPRQDSVPKRLGLACRAMLCKCGVCRHGVSVRLSPSWIPSKRINICSNIFLHRVAASF